jgi:putative Holliday junction resolvase
MRILALDVGDRRIGAAVSDPTGLLARPLAIITRRGTAADIEAVCKLAEEHKAAKVIVGLPLSLDGRVGPQAERVKDFAGKLGTSLSIPLELRDERFSTATVKEQRLESGRKMKKRRAPDDAEAAAVILQSYLDEIGAG